MGATHFYIYLKPIRAGLLRGESPPIDMHEIMALIAPRALLDLSGVERSPSPARPRSSPAGPTVSAC